MIKIKNIINKILNNKILLALVMACFSYITICKNMNTSFYDFYSWCLLLILFIFFYKFAFVKNVKKEKKGIILVSMAFAFLLVLGNIILNIRSDANLNFIRELLKFKPIFFFIGNFNIIYTILICSVPKLINMDNKVIQKIKVPKNSMLVFWISFAVLLICWSIYFFAYYPGILSVDSMAELQIIINNFVSIYDHHPILHVLFIFFPFKIGEFFFHNVNSAAACVTIFQMIIMALIFSYLVYFLSKRGVKKSILAIIILYFAIVPVHGFMSITMWKDIVFAGLMVLLTIQTIKLLEKSNITFKNSYAFIIISIITIFFRNNAIYAYLVLIFFSFIILRKHYKQLILIFGCILMVYGIIKYPVFNYFHVKRTESVEYIGIPLQQIGRMAYKNIQFTEEEQKLINKLLPIDIMRQVYNSNTSDAIKFNKNFDIKTFDNNKSTYLSLWAKLVVKHPVTAIEAHLASTLGYWYPNVEYWAVLREISENDFGIEMTSKLNIQPYLDKLENRQTPIVNMSWSIGLCFWIIGLAAYITKKRLGWRYLYPYIPIFGVWVTMMIASPVFAEYRYVYGAFTTLPILLLLPYIIRKEEKNG